MGRGRNDSPEVRGGREWRHGGAMHVNSACVDHKNRPERFFKSIFEEKIHLLNKKTFLKKNKTKPRNDFLTSHLLFKTVLPGIYVILK